ncbi:GGDEF domain-containing protein [Qipengyuania marisflavi]|nr:GGDEF domain-containing protein [Qipengyuania marisflavi]
MTDLALAQGTGPRAWPKPLRAAFDADMTERHFHDVQFFVAMGMVLAIVTLFVDAISMPDHIVEASLNRLIFVLPLQIAALAIPRRYPHLQKVLMGVSLIAFSMVLMRGAVWPEPPIDAFLMMGTVLMLGIVVPVLPLAPIEKAIFVVCYVIGTAAAMFAYDHRIAAEAPFVAIIVLTGVSAAVLGQRLWRLQIRNFLLALQASHQMADMETANARLAELSRRDPLTDLANRRHFEDVFASHFNARPAHGEARVAAMMLDLDHFKAFNDRWGHQTGDECLRAVADVMRNCADGHGGLAARFGGEEFVMLLRVDGETQALQIAEDLRTAIERIEMVHSNTDTSVTCTTSIGVAIHEDDEAPHLGRLLAEADMALYRAKNDGRNRTQMALPGAKMGKVAVGAAA